MTKNSLTFKHFANGQTLPTTSVFASGQAGLTNSEVHNGGEVWASMLWECYASLLNAYPFQEAQDRMKFYLLAGYKATPVSPTLLEARDALLAVTAATDPADNTRFRNAFAKRGAGLGAKAPERTSQDHIGVVESYVAGNNLEVVTARLDDSSVACDQDNVLDRNETGRFNVTVRNTGASALAAFTGTVSSTSTTATLAFTSGTTMTFPALQPGQTVTRSLQVGLTAVSSTTATAGLKLTFDEPSLASAAQTFTFNPRVDYDEVPAGSAADTSEGSFPVWSSSYVGSDPAWTATGLEGSRYYHVNDLGSVSDLTFTTPWMKVKPTGDFTVSFKTRWSFESTNGAAPFWDGGVLEYTLNDSTWVDVPLTTTVLDATGGHALSGRKALAGLSAGFPNWVPVSINLKAVLADKPVRFRFRAASDSASGAYGWDVDDVTFTNVDSTPFSSFVEEKDGGMCNRRPLAQVGANKAVAEGTLNAAGDLQRTVVTLDGSSSFDPDGSPLTYQWTQLSGPKVTLSSATVAQPSFQADVPASSVLTFQLVVNDGVDSSLPKPMQVSITNVNRLPIARPVGPLTANERTTEKVVLDGSTSSDADGERLTYAWTQTAGPTVTLVDATTATPAFLVPDVKADTALTFSLVVSDGIGLSKTAPITVTVKNVDRAPIASAGVAVPVNARTLVTLSGSGSDPDEDSITYAWTQTGGTSVELRGADTATPAFTAPDIRTSTEELTFKLITSANGLSSDASEVKVLVNKVNRRPLLKGPNAMEVPERERVQLNAEGMDPDDQALSWHWVQTGGPVLSAVSGADSASLSFTAPEVLGETLVTFTLEVKDTDGAVSEPATVTVKVKDVNRAPVAQARTVSSGMGGQSITLDASTSADPDGDVLSYHWTQVSGDEVTLADADTATPSFTAPKQGGTLVFEVTVTDRQGMASTSQVSVAVAAEAAASSGCSTSGSGQGSLASLLLLGMGAFLSRRRPTGRA